MREQTIKEGAELSKIDNFLLKPSDSLRKRKISVTEEDTNSQTSCSSKYLCLSNLEDNEENCNFSSQDCSGMSSINSSGEAGSHSGNEATMESIQTLIFTLSNENKAATKELLEKIEQTAGRNEQQYQELKGLIVAQETAWAQALQEVNQRIDAIESRLPEEQQMQQNEELQTRVAALERKTTQPHQIAVPSEEIRQQLEDCRAWIERNERQLRRNNLVLRGWEPTTNNLVQEVNQFLANKFQVHDVVASVSRIGRGKALLIRLADGESKISILKAKRDKLNGTKIFIDPDRTPLQQKIETQIREAAWKERTSGKTVMRQGLRLRIDDEWYMWDSKADKLTPSLQQSRKDIIPDKGMEKRTSEVYSEKKNA